MQSVVGQARKEKTVSFLTDASKTMKDLERSLPKYSSTITRWLLPKENCRRFETNKNFPHRVCDYLPHVDAKDLHQLKKKQLRESMKEK